MTVGRASDTDVLGIRAYAPAWPLGDAETSVGRDETSPWPALFCLLIGLLLGALAATLLTGTLQLAAFLLGAVISLVAAAASRHAALALLGALLVGHVTFTNEFAKNAVSVGGVPLYVTDVVLAVVMSATILGGRWRRPEATPLLLGVGLLAGVGAVLTLGATLGGRELLLVLRQSALFYYAAFALCAAWNVDLRTDRRLIVAAAGIAAGSALTGALFRVAVGDFSITEGEAFAYRFVRGDSANFLAAMLVALLVTRGGGLGRELRLIGGAFALTAGVVLAQHRSIWLAAALGFIAAAMAGAPPRSLVRVSVGLGVAALGFLVAVLVDPQGFFSLTLDRILTTTDASNANAEWRLLAWEWALVDIAAQPLAGMGLGQEFTFYVGEIPITESPHNSVVALTWHSGLLGLAAFALTQIVLVRRILGSRRDLEAMGWSAPMLLGGWVTLLVVACFNVILESPVGAVPFWLMVGIPFARGTRAPEPTDASSGVSLHEYESATPWAGALASARPEAGEARAGKAGDRDDQAVAPTRR